MKIKDIKPINLVLGQNINDFADATTKVNYDIEDLCCYSINNNMCYYWLNIESVWGPLGFVWDNINIYGHFNDNNLNFDKIPIIPDAYRLKSFTETFRFNNRNIEVLKSKFNELGDLDLYRFTNNINLIINSDNGIKRLSNNNYDNTFTFNFPLSNSTIISSYKLKINLNKDSYKYYPIKDYNDDLYFYVIEDINNPISIIDEDIYDKNNIIIFINEGVKEFALYINYTKDNNIQIANLSSNCIFHLYGNKNTINNKGECGITTHYNSEYDFVDFVFHNIEDIKDKSLRSYGFNVTRNGFVDVEKELYNKFININDIVIYHYINNLKPSSVEIDLSFTNHVELNFIPSSNDYYIYVLNDNINYLIRYIPINFVPKYRLYNNLNYIDVKFKYDYYYTFPLYIHEEELDFVINKTTRATIKGNVIINNVYRNCIDDYKNGLEISFYTPLDIRDKNIIVINNNFNEFTINVDNYLSCCFITGKYVNNEYIPFDKEEVGDVCPYDISKITNYNIINYTINYLDIYTITNFNIVQPLVVSNIYPARPDYPNSGDNYRTYLEEKCFAQLNHCEIKYIFKTKLVVKKDSILSEDKFIEIINAYIFNDRNRADTITLEISNKYYTLISESKWKEFINNGYTIVQIVD